MCSYLLSFFFLFKQKTAYEMRISDWSSDVCSSDLVDVLLGDFTKGVGGLEYGDQLLMLAFCKRVGSSFQLPASIGRRRAQPSQHPLARRQIGRASGRERVCQDV